MLERCHLGLVVRKATVPIRAPLIAELIAFLIT